MLINTLVKDIYKTITVKNGWFTDELAASYATDVSKRLQEMWNEDRLRPGKRNLRMSALGPKCPRHLWYSVHHPELAEPLPAPAEIKFSFGHMIEAEAIALAKASGHSVTGEQDVLELDGVIGHRDCVIDGCVVDVKSTSGIGFGKFQTMDYSVYDSFGYLDQLDAYVVASYEDPLVTVKDRGYILAVHKELGKMHLYEHKVRPDHIRSRITNYKRIVGQNVPPTCECGVLPVGKSGNFKLDTRASYSAFKWECFPNLRTFIYSDGPQYYSVVNKKPQRSDGTFLTEVDKFGNVIYR